MSQLIPTLSARVLIDGPSELVFDYALPEGSPAQPGCRVTVPLRNRPATGTILSIGDAPEGDFALRELSGLIDSEPLITPTLMKIAQWMAVYYAAPLEHIIRCFLPTNVRQENAREKSQRAAELVTPIDEEAVEKLARRAPRQHLIVELLRKAGGAVLISELGDGAAAAVKSLEGKGLVKVATQAIRRDPDAGTTFLQSEALALNEEQAVALEVIGKALRCNEDREPAEGPPKPILLHGVTGSGKTEVYLQATQQALDMGKSVLVLVPEIALTPQTINRFKSRFAEMQERVAVMHSHLSQGERFDEWHRIRKGTAKIVIGARSAIFAPLPELGLIIVDEEHEGSYKQDSPPRYHGRDLAVLRAAFEPCTVVLGSATPSLESYNHTLSGKYELVTLAKRADSQSMPLIRVIDMRMEKDKQKGQVAIISDRLRSAMQKRLDDGEQVILFLNRRGFARSLQCPGCGKPVECPHCAVPLTYHRTEDRLMCHICGHQAIVPRRCPSCNDPAIHMQGYGTEKVEGILHKILPGARVARIDADAMRRKNALKDTLNQFKAKKIDIIIGTQMIAKGLHFPNVTLVGVLNADLSMHIPDFRAGERTFQLLTQVAGRAGRGEMEGEVIIQTYTPHSPSVQFARHHDYEGYADQELQFRRQFGYPPFTHVATIGTRSSHQRRAEFTLETIHKKLAAAIAEHSPQILIGEPMPSPLVRSHGQYRYQLLLRSPAARPLARLITGVLGKLTTPDDVHIITDIDAHDMS